MALSFRILWTRLIFAFALAATALAQSPVSDDTFVTSASPSSSELGREVDRRPLARRRKSASCPLD
jgi:hypothetical protein